MSLALTKSSLARAPYVAAFVLVASASAAQDGPFGPFPAAIGDTGSDLVFTPVVPCRVVDTRNAGGRLTAGIPRDFDVAGALAGQGGVADCLVPFGPATAAVLNIVAVDPLGPGNLTAWAFGGAMPTASVINFRAGVNIANGVVVPLCDPAEAVCDRDLTIQANVSDVHLVVDVMGYFSGVTALTVPWSGVTGKPAGFADGVDNDLLGGMTCAVGQVAKQTAGGWACAADTDTNTTYVAGVGGGLNLVGTAFSVAGLGITSSMLGPAAVTFGKIAANAVGANEIASSAVGTSEIATNAVGRSEIAGAEVAVYRRHTFCGSNNNALTDIETCETLQCGPLSWFTCAGSCSASFSVTCANLLIGHLLSPSIN